MLAPYKIRSMAKSDLERVKEFTDRAIGTGYYSTSELEAIYQQSIFKNEKVLTLVLEIDEQIKGVRITYPPGQWQKGKGEGLNPTLWPYSLDETAYFQSLFVDPQLTGRGYGKLLSQAAIKNLKDIGAKGIVCHSWKESPHDSSGKYLRALGFELIAAHPLYWNEINYVCTRCGKPCLCTAEEMYLSLDDNKKGKI